MAKYVYGWDSENQKKRYMGKYPEANPRGQGYFGKNDAGDRPEFVPKNSNGVDREFVGSDTREYTFADTVHGIRTITADSFEEALREAEVLGYTRSDYVERRRRRRGR